MKRKWSNIMKTIFAMVASLVLGLVMGWYFEHRRAEDEKTEIVHQMLQGIESADFEQAARAVRAIQSIEAGDAHEAVRLLAGPIEHYYSLYDDEHGDDRRLRLRSLIEELARSNETVAARIANASTNARFNRQ